MEFYVIGPNLERDIRLAKEQDDKFAALQTLLGGDALLQKDRFPLYSLPLYPYSSRTDDLLHGILYGGQVIGYEILTVGDTTPVMPGATLPGSEIPKGTRYALFMVEADGTLTAAQKEKAIRVTQLETATPTATNGLPFGDLAVFEIKNAINILNTKLIGVTADKSHKVHIEYYG